MKIFKVIAIFILAFFTLMFSACKKDNNKNCYSAEVIHLYQGDGDPCVGNMAVLLTDVDEIPKGTIVLLISHLNDLKLNLNETIHFTLNVRSKLVPIPDCTLAPTYMFQIDLCD